MMITYIFWRVGIITEINRRYCAWYTE